MSLLKPLLLLFLTSFAYSLIQAKDIASAKADTIIVCDTFSNSDSLFTQLVINNHEIFNLIVKDSITNTKKRGKKIIASIFAFPIPFGILGLHRIFLGTKPYMPFVYIGTIGGCFGILPLIDFIAILSADEETFKHYENNPKIFMWSH